MFLVKIPDIFNVVSNNLLWHLRSDRNVVYLSFDDGPTPGITPKILGILNQFNARATFFCIGRNVERNPELYREIVDSGHHVGNHTYSHLKGWYTPNNEYFNDVSLASQYIHSGLFRPAYGMIKPSQIHHLKHKYRLIMWSVMSYDFHSKISKERCLNNVLENTHAGSIVVFHDSLKASEKMLYALPEFLRKYNDSGYTFDALPLMNS